jgi:hypothetical protein
MSPSARILVAVLGVVVLLACIDRLWPTVIETDALDLLVAAIFAVCAFAWVKVDARARKIEAPRGAALLAGLVIPVGVPIYLLRALGLRRGSLAILRFLGFVLVLLAAYLSVSYVTEVLMRVSR